MSILPKTQQIPFSSREVYFRTYSRGCILEIPITADEQFFGFGLQLKSVHQNSKKKTLRVQSDPTSDIGDSHAPVPFLLSSAGYGIYIDTARYCTFYVSCTSSVENQEAAPLDQSGAADIQAGNGSLYRAQALTGPRIIVDIPYAKGVDLYWFGGPDMKTALQRYNLFSGGGCMPPMYGLGVWYRTWGEVANEEFVRKQTAELREQNIPCDVYGLENVGWQTHTYSCTYVWNRDFFPDPDRLIDDLKKNGFRTNVWQHIFVHPDCPVYRDLLPYSGNYSVWGGLVPDFSLEKARRIFSDYQKKEIVNRGITGFKLDECDNSDYIAYSWSYPEASVFPSGMDGEQMHSLMGRLYQDVTLSYYEEQGLRSYHQVRSSHALAAPMPYVLYSDLYDHRDYVRGMVSAGYSGLLWSPEVRDADSVEELIRRIQSVIFSPMALLTIWFMPNPPWKQIDIELNRKNIFMENWESVRDLCRDILRLRMSLIPYLYTAFAEYEATGLPPFRGLPVDYPDDPNTYKLSDEYMVGNDLLFAAIFADQTQREVYFPAGQWYDFFTGEEYEGGRSYTFDCPLERILLFARKDTLIPLAQPVEYIDNDHPLQISFRKFGSGKAQAVLIEDDGETFEFRKGIRNIITVCSDENNQFTVSRTGNYDKTRYELDLGQKG